MSRGVEVWEEFVWGVKHTLQRAVTCDWQWLGQNIFTLCWEPKGRRLKCNGREESVCHWVTVLRTTKGHKSASHSFTGAGGRHQIPGSETRLCRLWYSTQEGCVFVISLCFVSPMGHGEVAAFMSQRNSSKLGGGLTLNGSAWQTCSTFAAEGRITFLTLTWRQTALLSPGDGCFTNSFT